LSIPVAVARELDLWPPRRFTMAEADTAGGPAHLYVLAERARVRLILNGQGESI